MRDFSLKHPVSLHTLFTMLNFYHIYLYFLKYTAVTSWILPRTDTSYEIKNQQEVLMALNEWLNPLFSFGYCMGILCTPGDQTDTNVVPSLAVGY